jgi:hypothetical protein
MSSAANTPGKRIDLPTVPDMRRTGDTSELAICAARLSSTTSPAPISSGSAS